MLYSWKKTFIGSAYKIVKIVLLVRWRIGKHWFHKWKSSQLNITLFSSFEQIQPIIEPVPTVLEEPIKTLWMLVWCKPKQHASTTNKAGYNHWPQAYQQYFSPRKKRATAQIGGTRVSAALSFWPITLFEVALSQVSKLGYLINSHMWKWLGLPRYASAG